LASVLLGLLTGAAVGALMSRGTVCFNAGVRRAVFDHDSGILRIFALAVGVQMLLLPALFFAGVDPLVRAVEEGQPALLPVAQVAGGLLFGIGMALAGGCISGILWKTGAGSVATAAAVAGFAAGELSAQGPAHSVLSALQSSAQPTESSVHGLLGMSYTAAALVLGLALVALLVRRASRGALAFGVGLGVLGALAWVAAAGSGYGYGLGFTGTAANVGDAIRTGEPRALSFEAFLALGVILGASLAVRGPLRIPNGARGGRALAGGLLMGFGANLAIGCNIGHGLTGVPLLSLGSILTVACMAAGALAARRLLLIPFPTLAGVERPEPSW